MGKSRIVLLTILALIATMVAACATPGDDRPGDDGPGIDEPDASTSLTIVYSADEGAEPVTYTLMCDPVGGDHPDAAAVCEALVGIEAETFEPVPPGQACTMIYGGPQRATLKGTIDGAEVEAEFNRSNGCEIARWDAVAALFPDDNV